MSEVRGQMSEITGQKGAGRIEAEREPAIRQNQKGAGRAAIPMFRALLVSLLWLMWPGVAMACTCFRYDNAQDHINEVDIIFEGVALGTSGEHYEHSHTLNTRFRVTKSWKGDVSGTLQVWHEGHVGASCGIQFQPGETYHVFANRSGTDGPLTNGDGLFTNMCMKPQFDWEQYEAALTNQSTRKVH